MNHDNDIKVISFDAEGTLVTPRFSQAIWYEAVPAFYAASRNVDLPTARLQVVEEYRKIGDQRLEWYDLKYWCGVFGLGDYRNVMTRCLHEIAFYPEVAEVLAAARARCPNVIISSASTREFLDLFTERIGHDFTEVFSSISDFQELKSPEFYETVCRRLDVDACQMVHVGDNWDSDYVVPGKLGIKAFFLDRSNGRDGPHVVTNLNEFLARI